MTSIAEATRAYLAGGISLVPCGAEKRPIVDSWKVYQSRRPTLAELEGWIGRGVESFAAVGGAVSGGLEIIDFDDNPDAQPTGYSAADIWDLWRAQVGHLIAALPIQRTGGGGYQIAYRCPQPGGNEKLAWVPDEREHQGRKVAIETRGEGGYALVAPSLHPSGNYYTMLAGDFASVPTIDQGTRDQLIHAARVLDLMPYTAQQLAPAKAERRAARRPMNGDVSVIDAYNDAHRISDVLARNGYTAARPGRYSRPGKPDSYGVAILERDNVSFHWSSNDPLHKTTPGGQPVPIDPFDAYALFEHGDDYGAAVKAAARSLGIARAPASHANAARAVGGSSAPEWAVEAATGSAEGKAEQPVEDKKPEKKKKERVPSAGYLKALEELGYEFRINDLDDTLEVNGRILNDGVEAEIRMKMRDLGYEKIPAIEDTYKAYAHANRYHPIKQYLEGLTWDGEDHIFTLSTYFDDGGQRINYADGGQRGVFLAFFRRWLIGAVAKVYAQAQNPMLVLTGAQGRGKSFFAKWLCAPVPKSHIEEPVKPDSNEHARFLAKKWLWEVGELGATTRRQDVEALKQFLTRVDCDFRTPYARNPIQKPALSSFIGTVNPSAGFLVDATGNRRYIVVDLANINWAYADEVDVNQLWAQAYHLWKSGESPALSPEEKAHQTTSNEQHTIEDPYEGWVRRLFNLDPDREDWKLTSAQITATLQDKGIRGETRAIQMRLSETLRSMGLKQHANDRPRVWLGISLKYEG
jgi:hypothetical protein